MPWRLFCCVLLSALDVFAKRACILFATRRAVSAQENKCCLLLLNYYGHFGALTLLKLLLLPLLKFRYCSAANAKTDTCVAVKEIKSET